MPKWTLDVLPGSHTYSSASFDCVFLLKTRETTDKRLFGRHLFVRHGTRNSEKTGHHNSSQHGGQDELFDCLQFVLSGYDFCCCLLLFLLKNQE